MFEIRLLGSSETAPGGERLGTITVGEFVERFACSVADGSVDALPQRWIEALRSLLAGAPSAALVHDPRLAWVAYREGQQCFIQQRLSLDGDFRDIPVRETVTEDGDAVSEWRVGLPAIQQFVDSQQQAKR